MDPRTEPSPFELHDGLHLRDSILWMDAPRPRPLCFISNAVIPGAQEHQKIISSAATAELLRALAATHGKGRRSHEPNALITPYGRPFLLGQLSLELFPSGVALGSSSLLVKHRGMVMVYAGDINPRRGYLAQALEARPCHVLALRPRFPRRHHLLPPLAETAATLVRLVRETLEEGRSAVLYCPLLGEAQEAARFLLQEGLPVRAHRRIETVCRGYRREGHPLKCLRELQQRSREPFALLWPVNLRYSPSLRRLRNPRSILVSGRALDSSARTILRCDDAVALSCYADYSGTLEYVRASNPQTVVLVTDEPTDLEQDLQGLGKQVIVLAEPRQMTLF